MSTTTLEKTDVLTPHVVEQIEHWLSKFPENQRQSALIMALRAAQESNDDFLTNELIEAVADYIGVPHIAAYEVATFYSMFNLEKIGQHKIAVCANISCMLCGSDKIVDHIEKRLGVKKGQTTKDGKYTLRTVECLGACVGAPMMQIDDRGYYEHLTIQKVDEIFDSLDKGEVPHGK